VTGVGRGAQGVFYVPRLSHPVGRSHPSTPLSITSAGIVYRITTQSPRMRNLRKDSLQPSKFSGKNRFSAASWASCGGIVVSPWPPTALPKTRRTGWSLSHHTPRPPPTEVLFVG